MSAVVKEKTPKEQIAWFTQRLEKVIEFHGVDSGHTNTAIFHLQAVKAGLKGKDIYEYASKKSEELHQLALDNLE